MKYYKPWILAKYLTILRVYKIFTLECAFQFAMSNQICMCYYFPPLRLS